MTDPVWAQRRPALFFHFLQHSPPESSPRALIWRPVTAASLPSLGPAPRLQSPGSLPSGFSTLRPPSLSTCMCSLGFCSITLKVLRRPWVAVTTVAHQMLPHAAPALPLPSTCGSTPALPCCLCKCWTRRQTHTNPQLSRAGEWISGIFHSRISISGVYLFCLLLTSEAS